MFARTHILTTFSGLGFYRSANWDSSESDPIDRIEATATAQSTIKIGLPDNGTAEITIFGIGGGGQQGQRFAFSNLAAIDRRAHD